MARNTSIGAMRQVVSIENPTRSQDAVGGDTEAWAAITGGASIYAQLSPMSAWEIERYGHTVGKVTHKLRIRAGLAVTTKHRVTYGSRTFAVIGVMQPDEQSRFLELTVNETTSGGPTDGVGD